MIPYAACLDYSPKALLSLQRAVLNCRSQSAIALVLLTLCGCHLKRGPVPEALARCRQLSHQSIDAIESGDWSSAEGLLAQAIEACPNNVEARRRYAETLAHRGALPQAVAQLEAALQHETTDASLYTEAGKIYLAMGDLKNARAHAEKAIENQLDSAEAWALRARVLRASGDAEGALADLHRAMSFAPEDRTLLLELAEIHRHRNQPQRALIVLQNLADTYPPGEEPQQVLYLQGLAQLSLKRYDDAVENFYAATVRGPASAELFFRLAETEYLLGRSDAAAASARQALAVDPRHQASRALLDQVETAQRGGAKSVRR